MGYFWRTPRSLGLKDICQPALSGGAIKDKQSALSIAASLNPDVGKTSFLVPCPAAAALWRGEEAGDVACGKKERALPGQPANRTYRGRDRENRDAR